jgi:hypothetical protein
MRAIERLSYSTQDKESALSFIVVGLQASKLCPFLNLYVLIDQGAKCMKISTKVLIRDERLNTVSPVKLQVRVMAGMKVYAVLTDKPEQFSSPTPAL